MAEEDASWVESHLLALAGLAEETELGGDRRNEAFSAWRRFLEGLAEQRPLVLVFEDLHWADEVLLDFVDELVDWIADVPLLVIATARPELLERRSSWGGGKLNASTLALAPLSDEETAQLLAGVLASPVLTAESQAALLERRGRKPALRRAVRPALCRARLDRGARAAGDAARHHRGAPRQPRRRRESSRARRSRGGKGVLDGLAGTRRARDDADPSRARAQGLRPAPAPLVGRGPDGACVRTCARPRRRLRADPPVRTAHGSIGASRSGSSRSAGRRTTRRCAHTTGAPRSSSRGRAAPRTPNSPRGRVSRSGTPATARPG
ncbi:MAG: AAA family ATPase [Thermoleophilia bacterium]|nr:AAA family ATPase [Thermoleophilia bacterium]